jgi:hypothetical protein
MQTFTKGNVFTCRLISGRDWSICILPSTTLMSFIRYSVFVVSCWLWGVEHLGLGGSFPTGPAFPASINSSFSVMLIKQLTTTHFFLRCFIIQFLTEHVSLSLFLKFSFTIFVAIYYKVTR